MQLLLACSTFTIVIATISMVSIFTVICWMWFFTMRFLFMAAVFADFDGLGCFSFVRVEKLYSCSFTQWACPSAIWRQVADWFSSVSFCHSPSFLFIIILVSLLNVGLAQRLIGIWWFLTIEPQFTWNILQLSFYKIKQTATILNNKNSWLPIYSL